MDEAQRQALIDQVEWLAEDSGLGHGIPANAGMLLNAMDRPAEGRPDHKTIVFLRGPAENYTDEELELAVAFALRHTAAYDKHCRWRRGCNAILFGKDVRSWTNRKSVRWLAKRQSWREGGGYYAPSLPEAMGRFDADLRDWLIGKHALLAATASSRHGSSWTGDETKVEILRRYRGKCEAPLYLDFVGRSDSGEEIEFADRRAIIIGATREQLVRLVTMRDEPNFVPGYGTVPLFKPS